METVNCRIELMTRDFFDPTPEHRLSSLTRGYGAKLSNSLNPANTTTPEGAAIPLDVVLDQVTGSDPSVTDYILENAREVSQLCLVVAAEG